MSNQQISVRSNFERAAYWEKIISEWENSGITKLKFCQNNQLTTSAFYAWYRKLRTTKKSQFKKSQKSTVKISPKTKFSLMRVESNKTCINKQLDLNFMVTLPNKIEVVIPKKPNCTLLEYLKTLMER